MAPAFHAGTNDAREVAALLLRDWGQGGEWPSVGPRHIRNVADCEDALMTGNGAIGTYLHQTVAARFGIDPARSRRCLGAGAPKHIGGVDPVAGSRDSVVADVLDSFPRAHLDT